MNKTLNIALVAHDARKQELIEWVIYNIDTLINHNLYATGTTGSMIRDVLKEFTSRAAVMVLDLTWRPLT